MTIPLGSYPGPSAGSLWRTLFALHRTGFGEPPRHRDAGGLLPHLFTLTTGISGENAMPLAVSFLCHFPSAFAASLARASCPAVSGLSSTPEGAAVTRPARRILARRGLPRCRPGR